MLNIRKDGKHTMEQIIKEHRTTYVYYQGIPLQTWWYSQKKLWFSHCEMNIHDFTFNGNHTDSENTIIENYVIWWDQILRHPIDHPDTHRRESMYPYVFIFAKELYDKVDEIASIFMLLAIRHSKSVTHKQFVCDHVRQRITEKYEKNEEVGNIWFRFWKASLEDLMKHNTNVLEYIHMNPVHSKEQDSVDSLSKTHIYTEFCSQMKNETSIPSLTISLSGGVDSMVLAYCADVSEQYFSYSSPHSIQQSKRERRRSCFLEIMDRTNHSELCILCSVHY